MDDIVANVRSGGWPARRWSVLAVLGTVCALLLGSAGPGQAAPTVTGPNAFYGSWYDGLSPSAADAQGELDRVSAAGIGVVRQYIYWDRIETSPGTYDWTRTDQLVHDTAARGLRILPTLLYTPSFYSSKPAGSTSTSQFPPSDPQTLARFAAAMVKRYGPNGSYWCSPIGPLPNCSSPYLPIAAWEVWNEPDYPSWWKGAPNAAEYAPLLHAVSTAIRAADPKADVVLGALTNAGGSNDGGFLDQLYALGAGPDFDTLSLNPYARDVGGMVAYLRGERAIAARNGDSATPIRVTEYGWATGGYSPYIVTTESCQAALLYAATTQLAALTSELNLQAVTQFQWHDVSTTSTAWPYYAGVIRPDDTAKPGLGALTAAIAGQPVPAGLTLGEACPSDRQSLDGSLQALTVVRGGAGTGTVTSSPNGISCGPTCAKQYAPGTVVTLTATPDAGSTVTGWQGASCSGPTCTITMDRPQTVTATFATPPGPPTDTTATPGNAGAAVAFTPPAADGGAGVTGYTVTAADTTTADNGGQSARGTSSPLTVTGLTNGDSYTFTVTATNAAGTSGPSIPSSPVTPADPARVLQESDPAVTFNGWSSAADPIAIGGSDRVSGTADDSATFSFSGTSVSWNSLVGPGAGRATVLIDGAARPVTDLYARSAARRTLTFSGLTSGSHTLAVDVVGTNNAASTGTAVAIDAFTVGTIRTNDASRTIRYDRWTGVRQSAATGGAYRSSSSAGAVLTVTVTGTAVSWVTAVGPGYGRADVVLDGVDQGVVDLYAVAQTWQARQTYAGLAPGPHTLLVRVLGNHRTAATGSTVVFDAVTATG